MSANIFISHSAKDTAGREYLDAIRDGLSKTFDVWVDEKKLVGGENWSVVIANEMAECHGAVAVCSTNAMESEYFKYEVGDLFARWLRESQNKANGGKQFRFCLVVVPPVTVDQVKAQRFAAAVKLDTINFVVADSAAHALEKVQQIFDGLTGWPSPLEALEAAVRAILKKIEEPEILLDAATSAGFGADDMRGGPPEVRLARLYMRCPIDRLCASLLRLANVLDAGDVERLFDLLAPAWVSFEAGVRLDAYLWVTGRAPADRFAVISGDYTDSTPLLYLMRARRMLSKYCHVVTVSAPDVGGLSAAQLRRDVEAELEAYVAGYFKASKSKTVAKDLTTLHAAMAAGKRETYEPLLKTFVGMLVAAGGAVVVVVPAGPGDFDLVAGVAALMERVTFVALRGRLYPAPGDLPRVILPETSPGYEELAHTAFTGFKAG